MPALHNPSPPGRSSPICLHFLVPGLPVLTLTCPCRTRRHPCRLASPKPAGASPAATEGGPAKLESELGEIKTLLAELLRSPRSPGSHSPAHLLQGAAGTGGA